MIQNAMLSRVADSLYWMSRYFERASHCARVLEANFSLMLNPGKVSTDQRWENVIAHLGLGSLAAETRTANGYAQAGRGCGE